MAVSGNTNSRKGSIIMGFLVHLKDGSDPIKIDADRVVPDSKGVFLFFKGIESDPVAAFPVANVSHVVKE